MNYTKIIRSEPRARHRHRHTSADRAVLSLDRRRLEPDQPRHRRLHRRAVLSEPEPPERHPEGELQREQPAELHVRQPPRRSGRGVAVVASHEPHVDPRRAFDEGGVLPGAVPQFRRQRRCGRRSVGRTVQFQRRHEQSVRHEPDDRQRSAGFLPELHRNRCVFRGQRQAHHLGVLPAGHVAGKSAVDVRLWRALPVVPAVALVTARVGVRAGPLRPGQGASALPACPDQRREPRARPGDGADPAERLRGCIRARHRRSCERDGDQFRSQLSAGVPRQPGDRAGTATRCRVRHHGRFEDRSPRQRRRVPQPARQRQRDGCDGAEPAGSEHAKHQLWDAGHAARARCAGGILQSSEQCLRPRARRQDACQLQLLRGRAARDWLGHRARRDVRRVPDAARRDGGQHQPGS